MMRLTEVEKAALERVIVEADRAFKRRQQVIREVILDHGGDPETQVLDVVDLVAGLAEIRDRGPKVLEPVQGAE